MFAEILIATILVGSLAGSAFSLLRDTFGTSAKPADTDYRDLLGPAFAARNPKPVRVTYEVAAAREELDRQKAVEDMKVAA